MENEDYDYASSAWLIKRAAVLLGKGDSANHSETFTFLTVNYLAEQLQAIDEALVSKTLPHETLLECEEIKKQLARRIKNTSPLVYSLHQIYGEFVGLGWKSFVTTRDDSTPKNFASSILGNNLNSLLSSLDLFLADGNPYHLLGSAQRLEGMLEASIALAGDDVELSNQFKELLKNCDEISISAGLMRENRSWEA